MRANHRKSPSGAPCPGIGEANVPARDRIVSLGMMGGGAFTLLKVGRAGPKSAKQVENPLANLPKILRIAVPEARILSPAIEKTCDYCDLR